MDINNFDYQLPDELIAQYPLENREESNLLILDKETGKIEIEKFKNILKFLSQDDVLVVNETEVIPARLYGEKKSGAQIEIDRKSVV